MDYLGMIDPKREAAVISRYAGIKLGKATRIVKVFNSIRERARMTEADLATNKVQPLWVTASTRRAIDVGVLSKELPFMRAVEIAFTNKVNPDNRPVVHKLFLDEFATDAAQADL